MEPVKKNIVGLAALAAGLLTLSACSANGTGPAASGGTSGSAAAAGKRACVVLPDTESSPRWESGDRPALRQALKAAGFDADIQNAQNDTEKYATIADQQLSKGCGVMLLVDLKGAGAQVLAKAKGQGIPVIAYDRPIAGADYYVSFDNTKVGALQGQMIVDGLKAEGKDPKTAKVVFMGGDPTDGNAKQFRDGAVKVMSAAGIKPAFEPAGTWDADKSGTNFEQAYTALKGNVDAVWVANDANAASVISVLDKNGKKVPVSGQDASIAGLQNILLGKQTATVYKPFQAEADEAGKLAVALLKGEKPKAPSENGGVPFFAETPILTDAKGIQKVIDDGNATAAEICKGDVASACTKNGIK